MRVVEHLPSKRESLGSPSPPALINKQAKLGEMSQLGKCLLCKHKGLSSVSRIHVRKHGMVAHVCNPRTGQVGTGGSLGELLPRERPCKTWVDDITEGQHWRCGLHPCATIHIGTHI